MKLAPRRTMRYYYLRLVRLHGDPESIARGVALGTFIGVTPILPLHTILILLLSGLLRANIIAALLAATVVSNPLTFFFQYYFSWQIGTWLLPVDVSWETIRNTLGLITGSGGFSESFKAFTHLGKNTLLPLLLGGVLLATPLAGAGYWLSHRLVNRFRRLKKRKQILS